MVLAADGSSRALGGARARSTLPADLPAMAAAALTYFGVNALGLSPVLGLTGALAVAGLFSATISRRPSPISARWRWARLAALLYLRAGAWGVVVFALPLLRRGARAAALLRDAPRPARVRARPGRGARGGGPVHAPPLDPGRRVRQDRGPRARACRSATSRTSSTARCCTTSARSGAATSTSCSQAGAALARGAGHMRVHPARAPISWRGCARWGGRPSSCAATTSAWTAPATRGAWPAEDCRSARASSSSADAFDAMTSDRPYRGARGWPTRRGRARALRGHASSTPAWCGRWTGCEKRALPQAEAEPFGAGARRTVTVRRSAGAAWRAEPAVAREASG